MTRCFALALTALALPVRLAAAEPTPPSDARALVQRVLDAAPDVPSVSQMQLTTPGGLVREFTVSRKTLANGIDARYLEVTGPMNLKDTRYLFYDRSERRDDQFMYLPFMRRIVRLSEQTRREPFLGSTFFVDDLIERPIDDYRYGFVGEETVGQRACRLVEAIPLHPEREPYGRLVAAIDPADLVVPRTRLYAHDGTLFKVLTIDTLEQIDGYWTPRRQTMDNVHDGTASRLTTTQIQYRAPIGDDIFREAYLGR
jgi:hypothetical protein